jgi:hypothetical protein
MAAADWRRRASEQTAGLLEIGLGNLADLARRRCEDDGLGYWRDVARDVFRR